MIRWTSLALELLEYKVEELQAGRSVQRGRERLWAIHDQLAGAVGELDEGERRLFERLSARMQDYAPPSEAGPEVKSLASLTLQLEPAPPNPSTGSPTGSPPAPRGSVAPPGAARSNGRPAAGTAGAAGGAGGAGARPPGSEGGAARPLSAEERGEREVLKRLARRVWWDDLDVFVRKVASSWRAERERATARLIYATLRNFARNRERRDFAQDVNLRGFRVTVPIPERGDPLVSLNDLDSLAEIVRELIDLVMTVSKREGPFRDLDVPEHEALEFVARGAQRVAEDPYAGELSLLERPGASSQQLRLAIQELAKERLPEAQRLQQRRALERRLAETLSWEREQRQLLRRDVLRYGDLVRAFFDRLADHLPTSVGGRASGPQLIGGVLFGVNPALRIERVPAGAESLTVRLLGPTRFTLGEVDFGVVGSGNRRVVYVGDEEYPLSPRLALEFAGRRVTVFHEGDYLHVKVKDEGRSLAAVVAEALTVYHVLAEPRRSDLLTVLKVLTNTVRGEPQDLVVRAIERAASVSERAPNQRTAVEGLLRGAARAAGVELEDNLVLGLVQRFHTAMTVKADDLPLLLEALDEAEAAVYQLTSEPLNIDIGGYKVTVRQYRGGTGGKANLVAMMPGQVLGSFAEYLIEPVGGGTLLFVRGEQDLAVLHLRGSEIPSSRAS